MHAVSLVLYSVNGTSVAILVFVVVMRVRINVIWRTGIYSAVIVPCIIVVLKS